MPLPEPNALELMDLKEINLLDMLRTLREYRDIEEPLLSPFTTLRNSKVNLIMLNKILRQAPRVKRKLKLDDSKVAFNNLPKILREKTLPTECFFSPESAGNGKDANLSQLLRKTILSDETLRLTNHIEANRNNLLPLIRGVILPEELIRSTNNIGIDNNSLSLLLRQKKMNTGLKAQLHSI